MGRKHGVKCIKTGRNWMGNGCESLGLRRTLSTFEPLYVCYSTRRERIGNLSWKIAFRRNKNPCESGKILLPFYPFETFSILSPASVIYSATSSIIASLYSARACFHRNFPFKSCSARCILFSHGRMRERSKISP